MSNSVNQMISVMKSDSVSTVPSGYVSVAISRTDGKKGKSGQVALVPAFGESTLQSILLTPIGTTWIGDAIDSLRGKILSAAHKDGKILTSEMVAMTAVLKAMEVESAGARLSKDSIMAWFDSDMAALITVKITSKLPGIASDKIEKILAAYKDQFALLSGRDTSMSPDLIAKLEQALSLLPDDYESVIGTKITTKLVAVSGKDTDLMDLL